MADMKSDRKKLMILGAGYNQLPAIRRAAAKGYFVITVDYLPDNIGHRYSHHFVNCSTVEREGVLDAARTLAIDGIATFASDVATPSVAYVAEKLGLPGCGCKVAEAMSNKGRFRQIQKRNGLRHPRFTVVRHFEEIGAAMAQMEGRAVLKPVDTSGSRGICAIEEGASDGWMAAFQNTLRFARSGEAILEEYVPGLDITGDGFVRNGKLAAVAFTRKRVSRFIVTGHFLPPALPDDVTRLIRAEIEANCAAVGYENGPIDFDVRQGDGRVTVIEMTPRLGGNGLPAMIERASGCDLTDHAIEYALDHRVSFPDDLRIQRTCGSMIFGSEKAGSIQHIGSRDHICRQIPEIFSCMIKYGRGDRVAPFIHGGNSIGEVLFDCSSPLHYDDIAARFHQALDLRVA